MKKLISSKSGIHGRGMMHCALVTLHCEMLVGGDIMGGDMLRSLTSLLHGETSVQTLEGETTHFAIKMLQGETSMQGDIKPFDDDIPG